jgi:hypothetical protein
MFCGFPTGVKSEPMLTAIASNIISLEISFFIKFESDRVIGTIIKSVMSFVKNIDKKTEVNIKEKASALSVFIFEMSFFANISKYFVSFIAVVIIIKEKREKIVG